MKPLNEHQQECLLVLMEECSEVIQAASKIKRFGVVGKNTKTVLTNLQNLEAELGDILALIDMVVNSNLGITKEGIEKARIDKMARLATFMHTWGDSSGV